MTHARLVHELGITIKETCEQERLPLETSEAVPVEVWEQYLPEDAFEDTQYLPFVLVEYLETQDDFKDGSRAQVGLTIGTYAPEHDGWLDAFHLFEVIRQRVLECRVLAKRFRLTSARWQVPDNQPREFFYLLGELTFDIFQPQERFPQ